MATIYPGLQFYAEVIEPTISQSFLRRTPSTYSYGDRLELAPRRNDLYVVCLDGSIESVWEPDRPIGWELYEDENRWLYRISQVGFEPCTCIVHYHSRADTIRPGGRVVGSQVVVAKCIDLPESQQTRKIPNLSLSFSRNAIIYENEEEGDPEVTSTARISPECPGAPRKVSRNEFFS